MLIAKNKLENADKYKEEKNYLEFPQPEMSMVNISSRLLMYSDTCTPRPHTKHIASYFAFFYT